MLHTLLNLTRNLVVFDVESTGTNPETDRIVELSFALWDATGLVKEWRSLVNPGVPIPPHVSKIHKITDEMMRQCQACGQYDDDVAPDRCRCERFKPVPRFKDLAASMAKGFVNCDYCGQNVRYDLQIFAAEMARAGVVWSYADARIVDSARLEQLAVPRSLSHLHEKYVGLKHDGAHGALSDVRAAATVIVKQLETHPNLPRDLDELHKIQWPGMLDASGKFKLIDGVATCTFGKHRGVAMRKIPTSYWDWLLGAEFPEDVKQLAREAKLGKFPEAKP